MCVWLRFCVSSGIWRGDLGVVCAARCDLCESLFGEV